MQQARGGMGSHKHGVSGYATKSPRLRLWERLYYEKFMSVPARQRAVLRFTNVIEAVRKASRR